MPSKNPSIPEEAQSYVLECEVTPHIEIVWAMNDHQAGVICEQILAKLGIEDPYYILLPITIH